MAYQNENRDSSVFRAIFYMLFNHFGQQSRKGRHKFRFKMPVKMFDSTLVSLSSSLYDWAHYRIKKGAVKMHTLLDYDCLLPEFVNITDGKTTDNKAASTIAALYKTRSMANRGLLPQSQADTAYKEFCRHIAQRRRDTDMDGAYHHAYFSVA